jgi:Raf kinase inhibitor-like YbhB/YbcL family protein
MTRFLPLLALLASVNVACAAAQSGPSPSGVPGKSLASITVTSKSLPSDLQLPVDLSCDGKDTSPQLTWSSPPEGTRSLVLIVDDPDAATHWVVFNLPADTLMLEAGVDPATLGAKVGLNDFRNVRYNGPCPPRGEMHRYQFRVFAADYVLPLREGVPRAEVDAALSEHVLGFGTLLATFSH